MLIIDSFTYVAHADDIVVAERGRLHAVASGQAIRRLPLIPVRCMGFLFLPVLGRKPTIAESFLSGGFPVVQGERGH